MSRGGGWQLQSRAKGGFLIQNMWRNRNQH